MAKAKQEADGQPAAPASIEAVAKASGDHDEIARRAQGRLIGAARRRRHAAARLENALAAVQALRDNLDVAQREAQRARIEFDDAARDLDEAALAIV